MAWHKNKDIRRIIEEVAEELNLTPKQVFGVLVCLFNSILTGSRYQVVKLFTLRSFGRLIVRGYVPKDKKSKEYRRFKVIDESKEVLADDLDF